MPNKFGRLFFKAIVANAALGVAYQNQQIGEADGPQMR